jgi:hypothetical protein
MPEPGDDLGEQLETVAPLVRDQDPQVLNLALNNRRSNPSSARSTEAANAIAPCSYPTGTLGLGLPKRVD